MKTANRIAAVLVCAAFSTAIAKTCAGQSAPLVLRLRIGEQMNLFTPNAARAAIGDAGIVRIDAADENDLRITAIAEGTTHLFIPDEKGASTLYNVVVTPPLEGVAGGIDNLLEGIPNARVYQVGDKVVIDGKLLSIEDVDRVSKIAQAFGEKTLNLSVFDRGPSNEVVADFIKRMSGVDTVHVSIVGQTAFLTGYVYGARQKENVAALAKTQVANLVDMTMIRDVMIETEILFLKVAASSGSDWGINLLDGGDAIALSGGASGQQSRKDTEWSAMDVSLTWAATVTPKIKALLNSGRAAILARPRICTKSGEQGKFMAGGEYYYNVSGVQAADLKNVEYGLQLTVKPEFVDSDELINNLKITVSVPISKAGSEELNLDKYSTENIIRCRVGQSIIMSGLLQNLKNFSKSRTPLLGDIPVLDLLFGSRSSKDEDTELIAIVTPRILAPDQKTEFPTAMPRQVREDTADFLEQAGVTNIIVAPSAPPARKIPARKKWHR